MTDFATHSYGAVQYPLVAQTTGTPLLAICDPAVAKLLDYFAYWITADIGEALVGAASGEFAPAIDVAVGTKIPIDPTGIVAKSDQFKFPVLAVWRSHEKYSSQSLNWQQNVATIHVAYILPPLSSAQSIRLWPAVTAASRAVLQAVKQGFHPLYNSGERVFDTVAASKVSIEEGDFMPIKGATEHMEFYAWAAQLELSEMAVADETGLTPFTGLDATITDESVQEGNPIEVVKLAIETG